MKIDEFLNLVDQIAEEEGFQNEFVILVANEKGQASRWMHIWNENVKRSKWIRFIIWILKSRCHFERIY
ncbi:MAG: hypothetical protein K2H85_09575 [Allobaculum sp.]|nr:hypothetical protein [Allobaculum sp.]